MELAEREVLGHDDVAPACQVMPEAELDVELEGRISLLLLLLFLRACACSYGGKDVLLEGAEELLHELSGTGTCRRELYASAGAFGYADIAIAGKIGKRLV